MPILEHSSDISNCGYYADDSGVTFYLTDIMSPNLYFYA